MRYATDLRDTSPGPVDSLPPGFLYFALGSSRQAKRALGNLATGLLAEAKRTFWTCTSWRDEVAMKEFMKAEPHRRAMGKLMHWCDEAAVAHWSQESSELPEWREAHRRMVAEGRRSKVRHPSPAHEAFQIPAPRIRARPALLARPSERQDLGGHGMDPEPRTERGLGATGRGEVPPALRDVTTSAVQYWEPRRIVYNGILAVVVLGCFFASWPSSRLALSWDTVQQLFILAVIANVLYCSAYVADVFVQLSGFRAAWARGRAVVLWIGIVFAAIVARFISIAIFSVRTSA